ncbi:SRPBCC family protein [Chryseobacterium sp. HMWF035]|uniref:SRPBCC family protein n=1 Tax=Chryseobacterium sp. HMWF035 TaxID=2056868 RepID=UPI000D5648E0|nr:SRPBCC family protein [Chryseobacterium sp. HMWF035]PVV51667.1 polyketide cyclase [Chryseobacterium sp. HMWF035]
MWTKSYTILTNEVTKEQIWKLFSDVNNWHNWDKGIEFAKIEGNFEKGNFFILRPKGGPNIKIKLLEAIENKMFLDVTNFPLAKMYDQHTFEETSKGLKITNTITVTGLLCFLWRKAVAQKIVDTMPNDMEKQIQYAKKL